MVIYGGFSTFPANLAMPSFNNYFRSDHFSALFGAMKWLGMTYEIRINGCPPTAMAGGLSIQGYLFRGTKMRFLMHKKRLILIVLGSVRLYSSGIHRTRGAGSRPRNLKTQWET
jgi:hypothetical protein